MNVSISGIIAGARTGRGEGEARQVWWSGWGDWLVGSQSSPLILLLLFTPFLPFLPLLPLSSSSFLLFRLEYECTMNQPGWSH